MFEFNHVDTSMIYQYKNSMLIEMFEISCVDTSMVYQYRNAMLI